MESHDVIKQLLQKTPSKQIASELGVSLSLVYKWAEPSDAGSGTSNPLDRTEALIRLSGSYVPLEWLCERAGGVFAQKEKYLREEMIESHIALGLLTRQFGLLLMEIGALSESGANSPARTITLRKNWEKTKSCLEQLIEAAEQGRFSHPPFESSSR